MPTTAPGTSPERTLPLGRDGRLVPCLRTLRDLMGRQGDLWGTGLCTHVSGLPEAGTGGQEWGGRPRTHLDTAAVSIPFWTGGQPLQWASEAPTILSGWTLAVHNLEGLGVVRRR